MPTSTDALKQQNEGLVPVVEGFYYCNDMGEMVGEQNEVEGRGGVGRIPIPTKPCHGE